MAQKKRPPRIDPLTLCMLVQGQVAALGTALRALCLAIPERRELIADAFDDEIDELIEGLHDEFPEPVGVGAELWTASFREFLDAGKDVIDGEPPEPANDPKV